MYISVLPPLQSRCRLFDYFYHPKRSPCASLQSVPHLAPDNPGLFSISIGQSFLEFDISEILSCILFYIWLIPYSGMLWDPFPLSYASFSHFFLLLSSIMLHRYSILFNLCLLIDMCCFLFGDAMKKLLWTSMYKSCVNMFSFYLSKCPSVKLLSLLVSIYLTL